MAAHAFMREWTDAVYYGERYANSTPDNPRAWRFLARCYSELGNKEKARKCIARAEKLEG